MASSLKSSVGILDVRQFSRISPSSNSRPVAVFAIPFIVSADAVASRDLIKHFFEITLWVATINIVPGNYGRDLIKQIFEITQAVSFFLPRPYSNKPV